jgi:iron complex outermembrane receptor protein
VDDIDLGSIQRIEVIRGPSSSLYGSAAGGVINLFTEDGPRQPFLEGRLTFGSYDFQRYQLKGGGHYKKLNYVGSLSHLTYGGYRDHSETRNTLFNTKLRFDINATSSLTTVVSAVDSPRAQDPGALNQAEIAHDRRQAAPRALLFDAGEWVSQQKLGLVYNKSFEKSHRVILRNYYVWRDFDNFLPFGINSNGQGGSVDLNRLFLGGGADYIHEGHVFGRANSLRIGFDIDAQRDNRRRFANELGVRGDMTTDQAENVTGYGLFLQDELSIRERLSLTFGIRYDFLQYEVDDKIESNSASRTFGQPSPMVGLVWAVAPVAHVYGNVSTSFEPPTTTELANPFGPTGFNPLLDPQTATNYEIGVKGILPARMRYEAAVFHIRVEDEFVPFELSGSGQTFFENAGKSQRTGLETTLLFFPVDGLKMSLSYTYSNFTFTEFTDSNDNVFDGNDLPGVPDNILYARINYLHALGLYVDWDLQYAGGYYANSANTVSIEPYSLSNLSVGYIGNYGNWEISLFAGIRNLFDQQYNDNIRLNASFGRYYEPAPELNFYGGIRIRPTFDCSSCGQP